MTEDAVAAIGEMIAMDMAEAHALAVDEAGFLGDGSGTYNSVTGVVNALITEAIVELASTKTAWSDFTQTDFEEAVARCTPKTFIGNNAAWFCSWQFYFRVMVPLILSAGGVTAAEMEGRRRLQFLGFPVEVTQVLPTATAADQIPCVFGNLRQGAAFGDRRSLAVKSSEHFKFSADMLAFLSTRRWDINVHGAGTGSTVEVLTALKTAAS